MFKRLLIANRGEIACRIMRTARRMGIETVAVYSDADRDALHVRMADRAVRIGPAAARESYLRIDAIVDAVVKSRADAVHPGLRFSGGERRVRGRVRPRCAPSSARQPTRFVRWARRSKQSASWRPPARRWCPGYLGDQDPVMLASAAEEIGYPLLIKASAGGGGKGMRVVRSPREFANALAAARRESKAAFGDDAVLLEKYLSRTEAHRSADSGRFARPHAVSLRARLLRAATASESDRGSARADVECLPTSQYGGGRGKSCGGDRLRRRRHDRVHHRSGRSSTSWR